MGLADLVGGIGMVIRVSFDRDGHCLGVLFMNWAGLHGGSQRQDSNAGGNLHRCASLAEEVRERNVVEYLNECEMMGFSTLSSQSFLYVTISLNGSVDVTWARANHVQLTIVAKMCCPS
ncbi:hypothetical protein BC937DRAFT_90219 [Endogone sp. FLAS-F59071]|nr:hypothetical protein BC937DRAFT_90219 [Endogone sp. FLAS-F59071]|eukprot:RUS17247.1 hypothetical protein BC937DRAFT_90219 [Endogone sp. FLAS-F59071]